MVIWEGGSGRSGGHTVKLESHPGPRPTPAKMGPSPLRSFRTRLQAPQTPSPRLYLLANLQSGLICFLQTPRTGLCFLGLSWTQQWPLMTPGPSCVSFILIRAGPTRRQWTLSVSLSDLSPDCQPHGSSDLLSIFH